MSLDRCRRCLEPGLAILVATVDPQGVPSACRGIAVKSSDDLETLTVYLPVATSHAAIQNLATTRRIAVGATHPIEHLATQLKGSSTDVRLAPDEEAPFVRSRLDAFAEVLETVGVPRRVTHSVSHWPSFAITMRVDQIFDQTPGPKAGTRLR